MICPTDEDLKSFGWAYGGYMNRCGHCHDAFIAAKRASSCKECAIENWKQHGEKAKSFFPFDDIQCQDAVEGRAKVRPPRADVRTGNVNSNPPKECPAG